MVSGATGEKHERKDAPSGYSAKYDICMASGDAANGVTIAMRECIDDEIGRQDLRLNAAYRHAMSRLPSDRQYKLRNAERAWIKARPRKCDKEAEPEAGGTLYFIIEASCFLAETADRAKYLEAYR